jgi:hypothetical protein
MKHTLILAATLGIGILYTFSACADKLPPPPPPTIDCNTTTITYDAHIKRILDASCNLPNCHDNSMASVFGPYNTLDTVRMTTMYNRVCVIGDMPMSPVSLTQPFIDTIRCWKEKGFLEN